MNRLSSYCPRLALLLVAAVAFPLTVTAATLDFQVLLDVDNNATTGCTVSGMTGVDQVIASAVTTTETTGTVTSMGRRVCTGGVLGPLVDVNTSGYSAGYNPNSGQMVVESRVAYASLGSGPFTMRIGFAGQSGASNAILTTNNGQPMTFPGTSHGRRRPSAPTLDDRVFVLDGLTQDWGTIPPLASGNASGQQAFRLSQAYGFGDGQFFWFRIDANLSKNPPPTAVDDAYSVRQGQALVVPAPGVLLNDSDPSGLPLTAQIVTNPTHGTLSFNSNGGFAYINDGAFFTSDSFEYRASNGSADSNTAKVVITILPNGVPQAFNDSYNVAHRGTLNVAPPGVLNNDVDPDGDPLTAVQLSSPANGSLTLNGNGSFVYTHNGSNTLTDSFQYAASDTFSQSNPAQVNITIAADIPPTAVGDAYTVAEGGTINQTAPGLFTNDSDPDTPQSLWVAQVVTPPVNGTLTMGSGGAFTYVHNGGETTTDSFVYRVNDGIANSNNATVAITITPVNDAPVAVNDAYNTNEDTPLTIVAPGLLANDTDPEGTALTSTRVANATNGNAVVNANGSFTYTPNANFNGTDTFTYTASDGTATSNVATVTITVAAVNDAPTFTAGPNVVVNEDSGAYSAGWATAVSPGPADESGQTVSFNISHNNNGLFSTQPAVSPTGVLTFTPALNANGSATVTVSLSDTGSGTAPNVNTTATVNFTITVTAVNDVPSFTKGPDQTVNEDAGAQTVDPWATAISRGPADEAGQTLNFNTSNDNNALFSAQPAVSPTGVLTYTPAANASGSATVTISLSDTGGTTNGGVDTSASQTFLITVNPVNDAPVVATSAGTTAFVEDSAAVVVDGALTVSDIDSPTLVGATVTITNLLDAGQETLAATVGATGITANYVAPTLTLTGSSSLANYQMVLRTITYNNASNTPNTTNRVVSFQVNDGAGVNNLSNIASKTVSVTATNDAPVVTASAGTTAFTEDGGAVVVDGTVTVTDADHTNLTSATVTITNLQDGGAELLAAPTLLGGVTANYVAPTLTLTGSATVADYQTMLRAVTYNNTSNNPTVVARTIAFQATDGVTASAASNKTVSIAAVNDAPVVTTSGGTTAFTEDAGAVVVDNGLTVTDIDSTTLASATVTITNLLDAGVETLAAPTLLGGVTANYAAPTLTLTGSASLADYQTMLRAVTYNNASNNPNTTNRTIRFQVNDGAGVNNLSNQSDKLVSVAAMNDAPVVTTSGGTTAFTEDGAAVVVDSGLSVTDVDNTNLASATVTITNLLDAGSEFLAAPTLLGGVTANYVAPTLTLTGSASLSDYQSMLKAVTYNNTSQNPTTTNRVLAFVVNDGTINSAAANKTVSVAAVNDAPVVTASGGTTAFVEDAGAVAVDGAITVTDVDSTNIASATVTITNLLDAGVETLAAPTLLGAATASYVAPTLTISGAATVAQYQTMLRAVTYNNASNNPNTTNRVISFQVNDGAGVNNLSNVSNKTVSVAGTNDAPVVTTSGGTTAFTEDGAAVVVDSGLSVTDVDNTNLASATVTITNLLDAGSEFLAAPTLLGGVTANYAAPTLTLTGSASLTDYQSMLKAVTYNNTSQTPNTTNRILAFVVNDGATNSAASNKTVSVAAVNDAPVVTASGGTTAFVEDAGAVAVDGAITVTDIDSTNLASATVTITNLLDAGVETLAAPTLLGAATANYVAPTLTISGAATVAEYQTMLRAVTYNNASNTPNTTNRVIRFQANDGAGVNNLSNQSDKTLSVAPANDAPVVTASGGTTAFTEDGGAVTVDTGVTVSDVDNTNLASATVTITNLLDAGVETLAAPTLLGGVTANYVAGTGILTLTGSASLADYQTMLRAVTYNNTSQNPNTTNRVLAFVVNDGAANSPASNKTVSVAAVNDAPVVTASGGTTAFVEDGPAVAVDAAITVTDIDSANLASATVTITNLLDAGLETLAAPTLLGSATASYVAPTLTISGAATVAQYQTMLRAVTYTNASNTPNTTNRVIRFQANDGAGVNNLSNQSDKTLSVAAANDAPVVTASAGTTAFTEDGGAVVIDGAVTVSDVDNTNLASATVTITNIVDLAAEILNATTLPGGITQNYVPGTGVLTLSGSASLADYQTALRSVTYNNTSNNPNTTTRVLAFVVNDGTINSAASNKNVSVTAVNDAPVVTTSGGTTAFVEDGGSVAVDGALTITDIDSTTLTGATVTISNLLDGPTESLFATAIGATGITQSYNTGTGVLTLSHATGASLSDWQTVLRSVAYNNTSNTPNTTNRVINFQVNDGAGVNNLSNVAGKTVSVAAANDAPVVTTTGGTTAFTEAGGAVAIDPGLTVTDVDSANIASATVTISNLIDAGAETLAAPTLLGGVTANYVAPTLTLSGSASLADYQTMLRAVTYNNASNNPNSTTRTINFLVNDGAANSNVAAKSVSVTSVNSAPVVTTSGGTTAFVEDGPAVAIDGALTVTDPDTTNIASATVTISNLLDAGLETLNAPTLLGGATASYVAPTLTISGTTTIADYQTMLRAVTYSNASNTPNTTNRVINFQGNDGQGANNLSNVASKTVSVAPSNDAPVVATSVGTTAFTEGGGAVVVDSGVTVSDVDSAMIASATVTISNVLNAGLETLAAPTLLGGATANYVAPTLTISGATTVANYQTMLAAVTYNNSSNNPNTTARTINFQVNDGAANSNIAGKSVSVTSVNSAPVVTTSGGTTAFVEDAAAVAIDGALTVTDADSANLTQATITITNLLDAGLETLSAPTLLGGATANFVAPTLTISGSTSVANYETMLRAVTYNNASNTPNITNRVIAFQVTDGTDASNTANKTVSVTATNDAPVVTTTGGSTGFTEDGAAVTIDSGVTVTDVDSANLASATVTITNLLDAGVETLALGIAPLGAATANYVAPTLTISGAATVAQYQTMLAAVTYNNTSQNPSTTARVIAFVANDGTNSSTAANKSVTVAGVNDAPVVTTTGTTTAFTEDGGAVAVDTGVTVTDIDSTNLASATVTISNIQNAGLELLAAPTLLGAATASYVAPTLTITGAATVAQYQTMLAAVTYNNTSQDPNTTTRVINFQVNDGGGVNNLSNTASKNVSVTPTNDAPTPNAAGPFNAQAGMKVTFPAGTLGGTDVEPGTTVTVSTTAGTVTNGAVTIFADGSFEFTPTPASAGSTATFQYNVCDNGNPGPGVCSTTPVTVTLNVAGPAIHFVAAVGTGTACTVPAPCTLATAVSQIGANTNRKIFIMDNGLHPAAVPLNAQGWLIGQGVTGASFDALFSITPGNVSPGTLAARPAINAARPTVQQTVSLNATTVVRGVSIVTTNAVALNDLQAGSIASVTVNDSDIGATGAAGINLSTVTAAAITLSTVNVDTNGGLNAIVLNDVAGAVTVNGGTFQDANSYALSLTNTGSLTTTLSGVTFANNCFQAIGGTTFGTLSVSGVTVNAINEALILNTGAVNGTFTSVSAGGAANTAPVILTAVSGNFTVSGGALSDSGVANPIMTVVGGSATIVWNGTLTQSNGAGAVVSVSGTNTGNITWGGNITGSVDGADMVFTDADGTYNINGVANAFTNGAAININTGSSGSFAFSSGTSVTSGQAGANNASLTIDSSSPASFTYNGSLSKTAAVTGRLVDISTVANTAGTITFQTGTLSATSTSGTSTGILLSNVGNTVNFNGTTTLNGGDAGVDILAGANGTFNFAATTTITNPTGIAFNVDASAPAGLTYSGSITANNNRAVSISNAAAASCGGTLAFGGTITGSGAGASGILVNNCNAGTINFTGSAHTLTTQTNNGVTLTNNGGANINFTGGNLDILTTTGKAFTATGGGTVRVSGAGNTLTTESDGAPAGGMLLEVTDTTIGAGGLNFVSATGHGNGSTAKAIHIKNAGSNGLSITGSGSTLGSGGTITNYLQKGIHIESSNNITLTNMNLTGNGTANMAASGTCGDEKNATNTTNNCAAAIDLQSSNTFNFTRLRILDGAQIGINGHTISGLTMNDVEVNSVGNETLEDGIQMAELTGTNTWTSVNSHDNASRQIAVQNGSGTGTLNITSGQFHNAAYPTLATNPASTTAAQGILYSGHGTANMTLNVQTSTFTRNFGAAVFSDTEGSAVMNFTVNGGTISGNGLAIQVAGVGSGAMNYTLSGVTITVDANAATGPISFFRGAVATGNWTGTITGNVIGTSGVAFSGSPCNTCVGMIVENAGSGAGNHNVTISSNTIRQTGHTAIDVRTSGTGAAGNVGNMNAKILNNNISEPAQVGGSDSAIQILAGDSVAGDTSNVCAEVTGNTITNGANAWNPSAFILMGEFNVNVLRLPGFAGGTGGAYTTPGTAGAYVSSQNSNVPANVADGTDNFIGGGATCF